MSEDGKIFNASSDFPKLIKQAALKLNDCSFNIGFLECSHTLFSILFAYSRYSSFFTSSVAKSQWFKINKAM